jgi:hypothetical protein
MALAFLFTFFLKINVIYIILGAIVLGVTRVLLDRKEASA